MRDRDAAWKFIKSWTEELFYMQFGFSKDDFFKLCERLKFNYPGATSGYENYKLAQIRGRASSGSSGPITMELKLEL